MFVTIYQPVWLILYTFLCVYYTVIKVGYFLLITTTFSTVPQKVFIL